VKPIHKILMTTDGSITRILEAITGKEIKIETVEQRVVKADGHLAQLLSIPEGADVNYRVVNLMANEEVLAHAVSCTPLDRLREDFREELMKADIPVGNIIRKHRLEVRREINWGRIEKADNLADIFEIGEEDDVLVRNYNIIHSGKILINITEYFPVKKFE